MSSQSFRKQLKVQQQQFLSSDRCKWCGQDCHDRNSCSAQKAKCRACGTMSHFASVCRKRQEHVAVVQHGSPHVYTEQEQRSYEPVFVDAVDTKDGSQLWLAEIRINGSAPLLMKADSGADVCFISVEHHRILCTQQYACTLQQSNRSLHGPDAKYLEVRSSFKATLEYHGRRVNTTIYVLSNVDTPLLSRQASTQLGMVARFEAVSDANQHIIRQYPMLFRGLGCMNEPYRIQLKSDAQLYPV